MKTKPKYIKCIEHDLVSNTGYCFECRNKPMSIGDIIRCKEYVHPDSYAYVIREKKTKKFILSEWSEEEAEAKLKELLEKKL